MRCVVVAVMGLGLASVVTSAASAADYGPLRGSTYELPRIQNWEGVYFGGHVGVARGGADLSGGGSSLIQGMVAHTTFETAGVQTWATAGRDDTQLAPEFGGFIGINGQWGDVVVGIEASYHRVKASASSGGRTPAGGSFILLADGPYYAVPTAVSGQTYIDLTDFGTIRGRAGWAIDHFLPYVTGGVALGRASYGTTATLYQNTGVCVAADPATNCADPTLNPWPNNSVRTASEGKNDALIYGWTAGFGVDWALTDNIFVRGEYEFVQFSQSKLNLNNARVGAGLKF